MLNDYDLMVKLIKSITNLYIHLMKYTYFNCVNLYVLRNFMANKSFMKL